MSPSPNQPLSRARRAPLSRPGNALETDFGILSTSASAFFKVGVGIISAIAVFAAAKLLFTKPEFLAPFLAISIPLVAGLLLWSNSERPGIPLLPLFLIQQGVVYGLPLVIDHPGLMNIKEPIISSSGFAVGLFLACCVAGWAAGRLAATSQPSRANFAAAGGSAVSTRSFNIALFLLGCSLAVSLLSRSGLIFDLLPASLEGLFSVLRTFADAAGMLGALLGGIAMGGPRAPARAVLYWGFLIAIFFISVADILLSGASGIILSAAVGLTLGKRKLPFAFMIVAFTLIGFLNQGKFVMRKRYWKEDSNISQITLLDLPTFYLEWAGESAAMLVNAGSSSTKAVVVAEADGQSILERVNNLQNMTFVLESLEHRRAPLLMGKTYALIPPLLIPRVFWQDKPRTHEGQILLNTHFGRQASVEETETTYIAWGLLPEAIGNFGAWFGPVVLGLVLGFVLGWLETVSRLKRLFSVEGMVLAGVLLITASSYEYVASVFLTTMFQFVVAITAGAFLLRMWFGAGAPMPHLPRKAAAKAAR